MTPPDHPASRSVTPHERSIRVVGLLTAVLGLLIMAAPFVAGADTLNEASFTMTERWAFVNALVVGGVVVFLGIMNAWMARGHMAERVLVPASVNVVLGIWLVVFGLVFPVTLEFLAAQVLLGLLLVATAGYNAWASRQDRLASSAYPQG